MVRFRAILNKKNKNVALVNYQTSIITSENSIDYLDNNLGIQHVPSILDALKIAHINKLNVNSNVSQAGGWVRYYTLVDLAVKTMGHIGDNWAARRQNHNHYFHNEDKNIYLLITIGNHNTGSPEVPPTSHSKRGKIFHEIVYSSSKSFFPYGIWVLLHFFDEVSGNIYSEISVPEVIQNYTKREYVKFGIRPRIILPVINIKDDLDGNNFKDIKENEEVDYEQATDISIK